jgi:uncharacterized protein (DUF1501 family)
MKTNDAVLKAGLTRRHWLMGMAGATTLPWSRLVLAGEGAPGGQRLVFVILRGGLDGLYAAPAMGDPDFATARGLLADYPAPPLTLDNTFALHPALGQLHQMYGAGELLVVHATGLPYHERSHFDSQQVLESGGLEPYALRTGWLGRALNATQGHGVAISTAVPLSLRGVRAADTWAADVMPDPSAELLQRLARIYQGDAPLAQALTRASDLRKTEDDMAGSTGTTMGSAQSSPLKGFTALCRQAGQFLAQENGPQAAVLEMVGWDSHADQANPQGALSNNLRQLDAGLAQLRDTLREPAAQGTWNRTVVIVATEFGRTVAINGTKGTDHGTGGAAWVLGGAVRGGRVMTDWPGLKPEQRFEKRDLKTTTDLRAVIGTLTAAQLRVPASRMRSEVMPGAVLLREEDFLKPSSSSKKA